MISLLVYFDLNSNYARNVVD